MFDGLIEFIEDTVFSRINMIMSSKAIPKADVKRLDAAANFTERNPGITRILTGDPLSGDGPTQSPVAQFFDRVELQLSNTRESEIEVGSQWIWIPPPLQT